MQFANDCVAVLVAVFEHQFAFIPIATHTFHAHAVPFVHQPFGEETGEVADAAYDIAAEEVFGIAHTKHPIDPTLVFDFFNCVHMHGKDFRADKNVPTVAHFGFIVIQHGE